MLRKILSTLLAVAMIAMIGTSVFAVETDSIETKAMVCGNCDVGRIFVSYSYSDWVRGGSRKCKEYPYGEDVNETRKKTTTLKCNMCGTGTSYDTIESQWLCFGHY